MKQSFIKKALGSLFLMSITLLLCALPVHRVRTAQNIRFSGLQTKVSPDVAWVFWEHSVEQGYACMGMKFNAQGVALLGEALPIDLGIGSVKLVSTSNTVDSGILIVYMVEMPDLSSVLKIQKLSSEGAALWTDDGIVLGSLDTFKGVQASIAPNPLGGAYVLHSNHNVMSIIAKNFNAEGENLWTANQNIGYIPDQNNQMALAPNGDLIYQHADPGVYTWRLKRVNMNGETVGSYPMFPPGAPVPDNARILAAADGSFLLYSPIGSGTGHLLLQKISATGDLVYSDVQVLVPDQLISNPYNLKATSTADGGFVFANGSPWGFDYPNPGVSALKISSDLALLWQTNIGGYPTDVYGCNVLEIALDSADNPWISLIRVFSDSYNYRHQLEVMKLSSGGSLMVSPQILCENLLLTGEKEAPAMTLFGSSAALYWKEANHDQIHLKKHQLSQTGAPEISPTAQTLTACLNGSPELKALHALGESSIALMMDTRLPVERIFYQVLSADGQPTLSANGLALDGGSYTAQQILAEQVSAQNTLYVLYSKSPNSDSKLLCLQEIDASGNKLFPDGGLIVADLYGWNNSSALGIEDNALYIYWTGGTATNQSARQLRAQKLQNGSLLWAPMGNVLTIPDFYSLLAAEDRYLLISTVNPTGGTRAIRIDSSGNIDPAWNPAGIPLVADAVMTEVHGSGRIGDDLYVAFSFGDHQSSTCAMQKFSPAGARMWGDAGIPMFSGISYRQKVNTLLFSDVITVCYDSETLGLRIQKINSEGEFLLEDHGYRVANFEYLYLGRTLVEYNSGAYSISWTNAAGELKHLYINPAWEQSEVQQEHNSPAYRFFMQAVGNKAHLVWDYAHGDFVDFDFSPLVSILSNAFVEPVSINDPTAPAITGIALQQNYPNPFRGNTTIAYKLSQAAPVKLQIFNLKGQLVRESSFAHLKQGEHEWQWDAKDARGIHCANGIYFYKIQSGASSAIRKMILLGN